jgi:DNA-binding transcriptional LysR family regulator
MPSPSPSARAPATFDLDLLRSFVAVVDAGSFAAGGTRLGRTQSAVTQQIQRLELQAGLQLFQKEGRQKLLTDPGRQLLRYAREMLALNDEAVHTLADSGLRGSLRIGSPHDVADTLLPGLLGRIARSSPHLRLEINVGRSPFLMESLQRGELDMTISTREDPTLEGILLHRSPTVWLSALQFKPSPREPLPLILIDEPSIFRRLALEALDRARVPWRLSYSSSNLIGVKAALLAGLGVTARSMELLGPELRVLGESDGLPRLPEVSYHLWVRPNTANPVARQAFELIRNTRSLPTNGARANASARQAKTS